MSHKLKKRSKKETFESVAAISTVALILTRIISVIYTIPFSYMVKDDALAVHNFAYAMFNSFYELSLAGLPLAIARLIAMYNARGEYKTSDRVRRYAQRMMLFLGSLLCLLFFVFAKPYAAYTFGVSKPQLVPDLIRAMQIIAPSLLLLPFMSGMRGYLQGFKTVIGTAVSQVVERLVFVIVLLGVLYFSIYTFKINTALAMANAFIALPVASLVATFVLFPFYHHIRNEHKALMRAEKGKSTERTRDLLGKIIATALPFVIAGVAATSYMSITSFFYQPMRIGLGGVNATTSLLEYNTISYHTNKLISIPLTFSLAMSTSIISFITAAYEANKRDEVRVYVKRSYRIIIFTTLSSVLLMVMLGKPLLYFFYGNIDYIDFRNSVLAIDGFRGMCFALETVMITILQSIGLKNRAVLYTALGPLIKLVLMAPLIAYFGIYGEVMSVILGLLFVIALATRKIMAVTGISLQVVFQSLGKTLACLMPTILLIFITNIGMDTLFPGRLSQPIFAFIYLAIMGSIGFLVFLVMADKMGFLRQVFGPKASLQALRKRYLHF